MDLNKQINCRSAHHSKSNGLALSLSVHRNPSIHRTEGAKLGEKPTVGIAMTSRSLIRASQQRPNWQFGFKEPRGQLRDRSKGVIGNMYPIVQKASAILPTEHHAEIRLNKKTICICISVQQVPRIPSRLNRTGPPLNAQLLLHPNVDIGPAAKVELEGV